MMGWTKSRNLPQAMILTGSSKLSKLRTSELNKQLIWAEKTNIGKDEEDFDKMFRIVDSSENLGDEEGTGEEENGLSKRGCANLNFFKRGPRPRSST